MKKTTLHLCLALWTFQAAAQIDYDVYPEVTNTYFINDVHIQTSPQDSFGLGDILIKDGRISQISRSMTAPDNAYVIEGDSAFVYPAFIAGLSHAGISKEEGKKDRPKVKFQGYPPNSVVGITPEKKAFELVDPTNESIKKMKSNGFAMAQVVPRGTLLPGQGSVMVFDGESNQDMVLIESVSQFMQMKGTRGFYPSTIIGVMAKWRDLYNQAATLSQHQDISARTPQSKRAKKDAALEALIPVTKKELPMVVLTNKVKDLHKALALKKELGYNLVVAEVQQGWSLTERLKNEQVTVLLSTKLPKEKKEDKEGKKGNKKSDKKDAKSKDAKGKGAEKMNAEKMAMGEADKMKDKAKEKMDGDKKSKADKKEKPKDPEVEAMKARSKKAFEEYVGQAAAFEKAGIPFAFSFLEGKPENIKKTLGRMMKSGLTKEAALAALTTNPARILGIDKEVGTLEKGKLANLFVSDAPYFDKESNIKMLFVEGSMTEFEVKKKKKKDGGEASSDFKANLVGTWAYEVETPGGPMDGSVIIKGTDDLSVTVTSDDDPEEPREGRDITLGEESISFVIDVEVGPGLEVPATLELEFNGDSFSGTVSIDEMGSMPITGTKSSSPKHNHHHDHNHKH